MNSSTIEVSTDFLLNLLLNFRLFPMKKFPAVDEFLTVEEREALIIDFS